MLFQSPFHYNECGREKFLNEGSFKIEIFPIFHLIGSTECSERDFSWNWISKYFNKFQSFEGHISFYSPKMLTPCLQMQHDNHNWFTAEKHFYILELLFFSTENLSCWEIKNMRQLQIISFIRVHYHVVFFWGDMIMWQKARTFFSRSYWNICWDRV